METEPFIEIPSESIEIENILNLNSVKTNSIKRNEWLLVSNILTYLLMITR